MSGKTIAEQPFAGDDGSADPRVAAALAAYAAGQGGEHAVLAALAASRLLVPVVAVLTEADEAPAGGSGVRREKSSEMALPTLVGNDGRHAVLAFTCVEAVTRWRPDARPIPVPASRVWQSGVEDADAVVIDVAGPVPLAVEGARLAALAEGRPAPLPHEDPDLLAAASAVVAGERDVASARLLPGQDGGDLTLELTLPGPADVTAAIQRIAAGLMAASGGRLRRGIAVTMVAG